MTQQQQVLTDWWESHANLCRLFRWLVDNDRVDLVDAIRFLDKPWQFEQEWREMRADLKGGG